MPVSHLRFAKSETRNLAELYRVEVEQRWSAPTEWQMKSSSFFVGFVVVAAALALLALVLR